jgi:hypothetical protein
MKQKPVESLSDHAQAQFISSLQDIPRKEVCILGPST